MLLSVAASDNDPVAETVLTWLQSNLNILSGLKEQNYIHTSIEQLKKQDTKNEIIRFVQEADLGIDDLAPISMNLGDFPEDFPSFLKEILEKQMKEKGELVLSDVSTYHKKFNANRDSFEIVKFSMDDDESSGTAKYFALSNPVLDTLKNGKTLIVDELDAKLHPNLTRKIIELFNCKDKNPQNAQLIFNTHDTNLLDTGLFRRDQIWFTEKNRYGAASLYPLSDIKGVRKDDNLEKNYIAGKYGAIPFLGDFDNLFNR